LFGLIEKERDCAGSTEFKPFQVSLQYPKVVKGTILTSTARHLSAINLIAALMIFAYPGLAAAQSPPTGLVSINRFGNGSGNQPALNNSLSVSADGRFVAFVSEATDLAPNDTNNDGDVFVRDRRMGRTILVSVNAAGTGTGNALSSFPTITPDGRYVAFVSYASNLTADASSAGSQVYVRDLQSGVTTLASVGLAGVGGAGGGSGWYDPLGNQRRRPVRGLYEYGE
jgi:hypothetical protein